MRKRQIGVLAFAAAVAVSSAGAYGEEQKEGEIPVAYGTIAETCDWGASVTKLVVEFDKTVDGDVSAEDFNVWVKRTYAGTEDLVQEMSYETFSYITSPKAEGERVIEGVYLSDEEGNERDGDSNYVTLEMGVHPDEGLGNLLGKETQSGLNQSVLLDCSYRIQYMGSDNGVMTCDTKAESLCQMKIVDRFTHQQAYTIQNQEILGDGFENDTLHYASYQPEDSEKHPLVIWLHGADEGGTDTRIPVLGNKASVFAGDEFQEIMGGAYILAPQTPTVWMNATGQPYELTQETPKSMYTETLMGLIETYVEANPGIDTNRIYIGGCSNGGYMTVNMLINYPEYFAAAFPVCEAYNNEHITDAQIERLKNIPIWFTHASNDTVVVPEQYTIPTYRRLVDAGAANVHFTYWTNVWDTTGKYKGAEGNPYTYHGHCSWIYLFNNECTMDNDYVEGKTTDTMGSGQTIFQWLSEQSKLNV